MNREVEERIVAMYFDNNDFEKNAKQTIDTLGQLKNGLNLEDSAKGFNVFEKIGKTLNFDKANQGLTKMRTTLGSVGDRFKKAFKIGTEPLREAEGFLSQLRGYITKYVGFDIAGKIVNSLESAVRSLTVQPISAGWNQYQSKMDSVKTIMSSTGESISNVNRELESMTEYANKTIYRLTDMTSNLGKFTNNGVELERAVKAMEGIANATADAGQGAQQASMAMYNISQAIGVGKMTTIDWKSLENANIATQKLKNTFLEMAALQGRIEKQTEKDGSISYMLTKDDEGNKLKTSIKLTAANFREYLSKGWLDKETMLRAFEVYSGTVDDNTLESWGIHDAETKKRLMELGNQALESATQVRTFSKMMDALAESAQSGWAQSFELIFGNMEQGTTLWTNINKVLDDVLTKSAEARNSILKIWAGEDQNVESENKTLEEKNAQMEQLTKYLHELETSGDPTGSVNRQINYIKQQVSQYQAEIDKIKKSDKPQKEKDALVKKKQSQISELQKTQKKLEAKQKDLAKQEKTRNKDEAEAAGYQSQIDAYKKEIEELNKTNIRDSDGDIDPQKQKQRDRKIAEKQKKVDELQKKIDKLNAKYGGDEIKKTKKEIEDLQKEIDDLNGLIDEKTGHAKSEIVDEQGRSGRDIAIDSLYEMIDLIKELGSAVSEAFGNVFGKLDAQGLFDFTQKIANGIHSIVEWFGKLEDEDSRISKLTKGLQGVFSIIKAGIKIVKMIANLISRVLKPVADWFVDIFGEFGKSLDGLGDLDPVGILTALGDKLKAAWEKIKEFFTPTALYDDKGNYVSTDIPVITWLKKLWGKVKDIVRDWANENGFGQIYDTVTEWWGKIRDALGQARETLIKKWLEVKQWFIDSGIAQFFSDVWGWITNLFTPQKRVVGWVGNGQLIYADEEEMPIVTFMRDTKESIEKVWKEISEWEGWPAIASFAGDVWGWITEKTGVVISFFTPGQNGEQSQFSQFLANTWNTITDVWNQVVSWPFWNDIGKFAGDIWNWIQEKTNIAVAYFTPGEDGSQSEFAQFVQNTWNTITDVWNQVSSWPFWNEIGKFAGDVWNWLKEKSGVAISFFTPGENGEQSKFSVFLETTWKTIESVWEKISGWGFWGDIANFAGNVWQWIQDKTNTTLSFFKEGENGEKSKFAQFIEDTWTKITEVWEKISGWTFWKDVADFAGNVWEWIKNKTGVAVSFFQEGENGEKSPFAQFIEDAWTTISDVWNQIVTWEYWEEVGKFFSNVWEWIKDKYNIVVDFFSQNDDGSESGFAKFISDAKTTIISAWETIRDWPGWEELGKFFGNIWEWLKGKGVDIEKWFTEDKDGSGTGFAKFLADIGSGISKAWDFITTKIPWEKIGEFLTNTWNFIAELIGVGGEEDDKTSGANKIAGRTRAAAGAMSDVTYNINKIQKETAKVDDPKITDKAMEVLTTILTAIGDFFVKVFDAIKGVVITPELERFLNNMSAFLTGIMDIVGGIFGAIGRFATGISTGDWSNWKGLQDILVIGIPLLFTIIAQVLKFKYISNLSNVSGAFGQSFGLQFIEVCGGILMAAAALSLLTTLDQHKLDKAAQIMLVFGVLIGGVITKLAATQQVQQAATPMSGVERFFTNLVNTIGRLGMLYIVINALPTIIGAITEAKKTGVENIGEDILKICEGIAIVVGGISIMLALSEKLTGGKGVNPVASISTALSIGAFLIVLTAFLDIIGGFVKMADDLGIDPNGQGQIEILERATAVMTGIGTAIGGFFGAVVSAFSGQITIGSAKNQMEATKQAAEVAATIDEDDLRAMTVVMKMLGALQDSLPDYDSILDKWLNGNKLEELGKQMPALGTGLSEFALKIQSISEDDLGKMQTAMRLISVFASAVQLISDALNPKDGDWMFGGGPKWNQAVFQQYLDAAEQLSAAVQKGMTENLNGDATQGWTESGLTFNAIPIIDAIIAALKLGDTAIARAVHDMVQSGLDEINKENPKEYDRDELQVNDNVIEQFGKVGGVLTGSDGQTFDLNTIMQQLLGDGTQWTGLMEEFDLKNDELGKKMNEFAKSMDFSSWMQTTDAETGEATDILSFLQSELTELGTTLDTMEPLTIKITPVFDMTNMTPDKLQEALMANPVTLPININNGKMALSFEGLGNELQIDTIIEALNQINKQVSNQGVNTFTAISGLSTHMDSIASEVSNLKLVLDTGGLVGQISGRVDSTLGLRAFIAERTGTVSKYP